MLEKKRANLQIVEPATGELLTNETGAWVYFTPRQPKFKEPFMLAFTEGLRALSRMKLTANQRRVLDAIFVRLDFENHIQLNQTEIANDIDMDRSEVNRAIAKLVELGIIEKGPRNGRMVGMRLAHTYAWKGSFKTYEQHRRAKLKLAVDNAKAKPASP